MKKHTPKPYPEPEDTPGATFNTPESGVPLQEDIQVC